VALMISSMEYWLANQGARRLAHCTCTAW
jgi:hypothetical protein